MNLSGVKALTNRAFIAAEALRKYAADRNLQVPENSMRITPHYNFYARLYTNSGIEVDVKYERRNGKGYWKMYV